MTISKSCFRHCWITYLLFSKTGKEGRRRKRRLLLLLFPLFPPPLDPPPANLCHSAKLLLLFLLLQHSRKEGKRQKLFFVRSPLLPPLSTGERKKKKKHTQPRSVRTSECEILKLKQAREREKLTLFVFSSFLIWMRTAKKGDGYTSLFLLGKGCMRILYDNYFPCPYFLLTILPCLVYVCVSSARGSKCGKSHRGGWLQQGKEVAH